MNKDLGALLLTLARDTLQGYLRDKTMPEFNTEGYPAEALEPHGSFVTLKRHGKLRGCIGLIYPRSTLAEDVAHNAISAATCDSRFDPVSFADLGELTIEVSVLTTPSPLLATGREAIMAALRPGVHGVILHNAGRRSTFLPQVWKELTEKEAFLDNLCRKGGMPHGTWYAPSTEIFLYEADVYGPIAVSDSTSLAHGRTDA